MKRFGGLEFFCDKWGEHDGEHISVAAWDDDLRVTIGTRKEISCCCTE